MACCSFSRCGKSPPGRKGTKFPRNPGARLGKGDQTASVYTTGHNVTLWPIKIVEAKYYTRELASLEIPQATLAATGAKAGIRIRLQTTAGVKFNQLGIDRLPIRHCTPTAWGRGSMNKSLATPSGPSYNP